MITTIDGSITSFNYDPLRDGYTSGSIFATISGTPAISTSYLRLNNARVVGVQALKGPGLLEMDIIVPTAPTAGHARSWGRRLPFLGNRASMVFDITGKVFSALVYNNAGTLVFSKAITWSAEWTNVNTKYAINVGPSSVDFYVAGTLVASAGTDPTFTANRDNMPSLPVSLDINNGVADNMDIAGTYCDNILYLA